MTTVKFNNIDSSTDLNLLLTNRKIGNPEPKTEYIDVPGRGAPLDFTEFFGDVQYENRKLEFDFLYLEHHSTFTNKYSELLNKLQGRKMKITLSDDPDFYYLGRITVGDWENDNSIGKVNITVECDAYKYKKTETVKSITLTGTDNIKLSNFRKWVVPKVKTTRAITLKWGENTAKIEKDGEYTIPSLILVEGDTNIEITGTSGTVVTFTYQEGGL